MTERGRGYFTDEDRGGGYYSKKDLVTGVQRVDCYPPYVLGETVRVPIVTGQIYHKSGRKDVICQFLEEGRCGLWRESKDVRLKEAIDRALHNQVRPGTQTAAQQTSKPCVKL